MTKRGSDDLEWQELKKYVTKRDKNTCRLSRVLLASDYRILRGRAGSLLNTLDPAHIFAVGSNPKLCYEKDNVVLLNRYSHEMLDSCKHPIRGTPISKEERDAWWAKIVGDDIFQKLLLIKYE